MILWDRQYSLLHPLEPPGADRRLPFGALWMLGFAMRLRIGGGVHGNETHQPRHAYGVVTGKVALAWLILILASCMQLSVAS